MESHFSTQDLVNTALNIIYEDFEIKPADLLRHLEGAGLGIPQSTLSKAYTLRKNEQGWYAIPRILTSDRLKTVLHSIKQYLENQHKVVFVDKQTHLFEVKGPKNGKKWELKKGPILEYIPEEVVAQNLGGLVKVHETLDLYKLYELIAQAKLVEILTTYFTSLDVLIDKLVKAINDNNCKIRILMLDPHLDVIRQRAKGLSNKVGENPVEIAWRYYYKLVKFQEEYPRNVEFYLYNAIPGFAFYRIDNRMIVGYQWFNRFSRAACHHEYVFLPDRPSPFIKNLLDHWRDLWNYAKHWKDINRYSHKLTCYIIHDEGLTSMDLMINPENNDAMLLRTPSGIRYHGSVNNLRSGSSTIQMYAEKEDLWTISFNLDADLKEFDLLELVTGIYTVNSPKARENLARCFVMVNHEGKLDAETALSEEQKETISRYLNGHFLRTARAANWQALKDATAQYGKQ